MTSPSEAPPARALPRLAGPSPTDPAARAGSLSLTLCRTGSTTILTMVGCFDVGALRAVEHIVEHIGGTTTDHLAVDAAALDMVDAPGVRMLMALDCYMRARGGRLTVLDAHGAVEATLASAGLAVRSRRRPLPGSPTLGPADAWSVLPVGDLAPDGEPSPN